MRLAVTATSGHLGRLSVESLLSQGIPPSDIVAIARSPAKAATLADRGVEVRHGDYDLPATLLTALRGVDRLLVVPSTAMPAPRVVQHQALLDAAREAGVGHVLLYSLIGTHPDSPFLIAPYLLFAERALRSAGLDWTILRTAYYADPLVEWVPGIVELGTIPYPTGSGRLSFASRADTARAGAAALAGEGHAGQIYELTGPRTLTTEELCATVAEATGRTVQHREATVEDYVAVCVADGMPEPFARLLATLYTPVARGLTDRCTDHIAQLSGRPPLGLPALIQARFPSGLPG